MYILKIISFILIIIGGINWGLVGFFGFDLVAAIFGDMSLLARITYAIVGVSAILSLLTFGDVLKNADK